MSQCSHTLSPTNCLASHFNHQKVSPIDHSSLKRKSEDVPQIRLPPNATHDDVEKKISMKTYERFYHHRGIILAGDFNARLDCDSHLTNSKIVGNSVFHDFTNHIGHILIEPCKSTELRPIHTHLTIICVSFQPTETQMVNSIGSITL